jgi:alanine or glycine:cation symporter, AGCS family
LAPVNKKGRITVLETLNQILSVANDYIWHEYVLFFVLALGILFTVATKFSPLICLTHGFAILFGRYDKDSDPGAISHFQALSAALSATVGLGNIGGVAIAVSMGGPGAVFWMWVVGLMGMSIKLVEVSQSMLYRDTHIRDEPHGGPMWVADKGLAKLGFATLGKWIAGIFCITTIVSAITGGNMFQVLNVADVTQTNFGVDPLVSGAIMTLLVGSVIVGGIKRIGSVAGTLVPFMCGIYLIAALAVVIVNIADIPSMFKLIIVSAFSPLEAQGAFIGGTFGYAFMWGMKRALFSNEAGQGSSPIAHSAARTKEPIREGIVAGLEPFIDTLVVCTLTSLVILSSGAWNRGAVVQLESDPLISKAADNSWQVEDQRIPNHPEINQGSGVFLLARIGTTDLRTNTDLIKIYGAVSPDTLGDPNFLTVRFQSVQADYMPRVQADLGVYVDYFGAALTSHAFDRVFPGLGFWMVTLASWLFGVSTIISWSYYGEQSTLYLFGEKSVMPYRIIYSALIMVTTLGIIQSEEALDNISSFGTGVMLLANIPIMILFANEAISAYHQYVRRLKAKEF